MPRFDDPRMGTYVIYGLGFVVVSGIAMAALTWSLHNGLVITYDNAYWLVTFPAYVALAWFIGWRGLARQIRQKRL